MAGAKSVYARYRVDLKHPSSGYIGTLFAGEVYWTIQGVVKLTPDEKEFLQKRQGELG